MKSVHRSPFTVHRAFTVYDLPLRTENRSLKTHRKLKTVNMGFIDEID